MLKNTLKNSTKFLDLFYDPLIDSQEVTKKSKVSLYLLRVDGGRFDYEALYKQLGNASLTYVLSREKYDSYSKEEMHEAVKYVQGKFRDADINDGEGGELLLYCFLEAHLGAPKILSKMELKTSSKHYSYGSDGIHLLDLGEGAYHIIFGESKMIGDSKKKGSSLKKGIKDAISSIRSIEEGGTSREIELVDSHLMKESFDSTTIEKLKSILIPKARNTVIDSQKTFGIFLGFEIDITDWDLENMSSKDFEKKIKQSTSDLMSDSFEYLKQQIKSNGLDGYHFYVYCVPFIKNNDTDINKVRRQIIREL